MALLGLERTIVDDAVYERTSGRFREAGVLATLSRLAAWDAMIPELIARSGAAAALGA